MIVIIIILIFLLIIEIFYSPRLYFYEDINDSEFDNPVKEHCLLYYNDIYANSKARCYKRRKLIHLY